MNASTTPHTGLIGAENTQCQTYREYGLEIEDLKRRAALRADLNDSYYFLIGEFRSIAYRHAKNCRTCIAEGGQ